MSASHIVILCLMLATLFVLIAGIVVMMKGGEVNRKYSNRLMLTRVGLQALTLGVLGLLFLMR